MNSGPGGPARRGKGLSEVGDSVVSWARGLTSGVARSAGDLESGCLMEKPAGRKFFNLHLIRTYKRRAPLILVNGLAEQSESWFANRTALGRHFDVKVPEILVYDGAALHRHLDDGG